VEKPFKILEQVERSTNTYALDMIPRAIPELIKGRSWSLSTTSNGEPGLRDEARQRKQGYSESLKDYMVDMQTMMRTLRYSLRETLKNIIFLGPYKVSELDTLMI